VRDREGKLITRVQYWAYIALLLMALISLLALGTDVSKYIRSTKGARGLSLEITSLKLIDDDNPRTLIRFRVRNDSPLQIRIERYSFVLYLNGKSVGSSYSMYLGTDSDVDPAAHRAAQEINQVLAPERALDLEFTVYIHSTQMEIVRQAQRSGPMSWYTSSDLNIFLPHAREKSFLKLRAGFEE